MYLILLMRILKTIVSPYRFSLPINQSNKNVCSLLIYNWTIVFNPLFYQVLDRRPPRLVVCRHEKDCISFESIESFQQEVLINLFLVSGNIRLSTRVYWYWWTDSSWSENSMVRHLYIHNTKTTKLEKSFILIHVFF